MSSRPSLDLTSCALSRGIACCRSSLLHIAWRLAAVVAQKNPLFLGKKTHNRYSLGWGMKTQSCQAKSTIAPDRKSVV